MAFELTQKAYQHRMTESLAPLGRLILLALAHMAPDDKGEIEVDQGVIADMIGTYKPHVSRILRELQRAGLIEISLGKFNPRIRIYKLTLGA